MDVAVLAVMFTKLSRLDFFWIFSLYFIQISYAYDHMENELINTPEVECQGRQLGMVLATKAPFMGKVYAKGMHDEEGCSFDYSKTDAVNYKNVTKIFVTLDYSRCHTERIRTLQPGGVTYMNTLVVQFHDTFITNADKAYHVRCFYSELQKTVTSGFDVSMIPTDPLHRDLTMPTCTYSVRRGTANGPLVKTAQVGDIVYHRWDCNGNDDVYGMLVHSCLVENEKGSKREILNSKGCSIDKHILPDLHYNNELNLAYAESKVFKFPDNSFVHFKCQIMICTKINNDCDKIAPPVCDYNRQARALPYSWDSPNMDVLADQILVLEDGQQEYLQSIQTMGSQNNPTQLTMTSDFDSVSFGNSRANTLGSAFSGGDQISSAQACANRILMFCILVGFVVFFGTSIIFMVYLLVRNRQGLQALKEQQAIDWLTTPGPITRQPTKEWGKNLNDFIVSRKSDYE